jgi:uncharacterized membrane protein
MSAPQTFDFPRIADIPAMRPFAWLRAGWQDMRANLAGSLFYGLAFALMGAALYFAFDRAAQTITTLSIGFLLLGPVLAIGIYDLSRQREMAEWSSTTMMPRWIRSLTAWRRNPGGIGIYVLILTIVFLVWARASLVTFALFETRGMPTLHSFIAQLQQANHAPFLFAFFGIACLFAFIVYVFSVISIPALLDGRFDTVTAAAISVVSVMKNPTALMVWAACIVVLIGVGLVTAFIGLIFTAPLIGHATWHAYRELVPDSTTQSSAVLAA